MISWWDQWCDLAAILLTFVFVLLVLHLTERKSSGAGRSPCPRPAPVFCVCASPDLDSIGECQTCHRKPRSEMVL